MISFPDNTPLIHTHARARTHTHKHTYTHSHTHTHTHAHTCTYIHAHTHTHVNTHSYTPTSYIINTYCFILWLSSLDKLTSELILLWELANFK